MIDPSPTILTSLTLVEFVSSPEGEVKFSRVEGLEPFYRWEKGSSPLTFNRDTVTFLI